MAYPTPAAPGTSLRIRRASVPDAGGIAALYIRVYTPEDGGEARDHYPFPQILEPDGVTRLIAGGGVVWVVAEADGEVVGSAAALRNIGGADDRVAEVFGVAVDAAVRQRGVGSAVLRRIVEELGDAAEFVLCEARTAESGGWKVARNAGFRPVGYAPYAHAMPVGFESMVLTGYARSWASQLNPVDAAGLPEPAFRLAAAVLRPEVGASPSAGRGARGSAALGGAAVTVRRDDLAGQAWFRDEADHFDRRVGVVGLCPLEGVDSHGQRFDHPYYLASLRGVDVGCARVAYDRTDARGRVLGLRAHDESARRALLEGILADLTQLAGGGPLTVLGWVRADAAAAQDDFHSLGFFPTAYLPGLIANPDGRKGVVQYTRLVGRSLSESTREVTALDWPEARVVIEQVVQLKAAAPS